MHRRTWLAALTTLIALVLAAGLTLAAPAQAASANDEQGFVDSVNKERTDRQLRPLIFDMKIRDVSRAWSDQMASSGSFVHNPNYSKQIPAGWSSAAENIAWGSGSNATVAVLHQALMDSPGHRANILGDFTRIGVGVTIVNGKMYVTENFGKYAGDPVPTTPSTTVPPTTTPPTTTPPTTTPPTTVPPAQSASYLLTLAMKGKGTVSSNPTGISCAGDCTESYASGTTVTLTATPRSARPPVWSGACTGRTTTCTVAMTAARSVKITFK
jgi:hypothetical protein